MTSTWKKNWCAGPDSDYLEAIGQVVVNASMVEAHIRPVIWKFAKIDEHIGRCFTGNMRISELIQILKSVVHLTQTDPEFIRVVDETCTNIKKLFEERGKIIHQIWGVGDAGANLSKHLLARTKDQEGTNQYPLEAVRKLAEDFFKIQFDLLALTITEEMRRDMPDWIFEKILSAPWLKK